MIFAQKSLEGQDRKETSGMDFRRSSNLTPEAHAEKLATAIGRDIRKLVRSDKKSDSKR